MVFSPDSRYFAFDQRGNSVFTIPKPGKKNGVYHPGKKGSRYSCSSGYASTRTKLTKIKANGMAGKLRDKRIGFFLCLISFIFLFCGISFAFSQSPPISRTPTYSGFKEIDPALKHFVIIGDTQRTSSWEFWRERNGRERKLIIEEIARREPAFVLHLGDLTARGSSVQQWREFDELHKQFLEKKIPYFPILGNHDLYGNHVVALQHYFDRFPHLQEKRWYSFVWKGIAVISVDSNFSSFTKEEKKSQEKWYLSELQRLEEDRSIGHIIICCHEPPFTNSRIVRPNSKVKTSFADPFLRYSKTHFFFSGHSHSYERFQIEGKFFIVSGGGGGPRHQVFTDPRRIRYMDSFQGPELRFFHLCEIEFLDGKPALKVLRLESMGTFSIADQVSVVK
jgi:predicted phosphodiesterase